MYQATMDPGTAPVSLVRVPLLCTFEAEIFCVMTIDEYRPSDINRPNAVFFLLSLYSLFFIPCNRPLIFTRL